MGKRLRLYLGDRIKLWDNPKVFYWEEGVDCSNICLELQARKLKNGKISKRRKDFTARGNGDGGKKKVLSKNW